MTAATLALRLDAPMQSWGVRSRFINRFTAMEPTKSGVVGLLAAARGLPRTDAAAVRELAGMRMGVRVDREGLLERDYHVTEGVPNTEGRNHRTVVSNRYYLADALFLVVVEGPAQDLGELEAAVRAPHWPLFFGRKAFVPAAPLLDSEGRWGTGIQPGSLEDRLATHPWLENREGQRNEVSRIDGDTWLRTVADVPAAERDENLAPLVEIRHDHPESFVPGHRRFRSRAVRADHVRLTDAMITGAHPCS